MSEPRFPEVDVCLSEKDSNAFSLMNAVVRGLRKSGVPASEIHEFSAEAKSGDYDNLIQVCQKWVNVS